LDGGGRIEFGTTEPALDLVVRKSEPTVGVDISKARFVVRREINRDDFPTWSK
tara:strand:+ start:1100 stop:1258 length:159 start_codon:yes stop_codon:yes gene_type:complete